MPHTGSEKELSPAALVRPLLLAILAIFAMNLGFVFVGIGNIDRTVRILEEQQATILVQKLSSKPLAEIVDALRQSGFSDAHILSRDYALPGETTILITSPEGLRRGTVAFTAHMPGLDTVLNGMPVRFPIIIVCVLTVLFLLARLKKQTGRIEARRLRAQMLAHTDALSGLPNRRPFRQKLPQILARAQRNNVAAALYFIDLDSFKQVNDTYGHGVGDELIRQVASRLQTYVSKNDFIARLSGDEFAIIRANGGTPNEALAFGQSLVDAIATPFDLEGCTLRTGASVGISLSDMGHAPNAHDICRSADDALYAAKKDGRSCAKLFTTGFKSSFLVDRDAWIKDSDGEEQTKSA